MRAGNRDNITTGKKSQQNISLQMKDFRINITYFTDKIREVGKERC
jgi:hypothetical protein